MKLSIYSISLIISLTLLNFSCNNESKPEEQQLSTTFPMQKQYWDVADYDAILSELSVYQEGKKLPNLSDPNTAPAFSKLIDVNNVAVVVEDTTLGTIHRSNFASEMFDNYKDLYDDYSKLDREDKYIYPSEIAEIVLFGVYTQIYYFKLGNDKIIKESTDANSEQAKSVLRRNAQVVVDNLKISLDHCKKEKALTPDAIHRLAIGFEKYLPLLFKTFSASDYSELKSQIEVLLTTVNSSELKQMLTNAKAAIEKLESEHPETSEK